MKAALLPLLLLSACAGDDTKHPAYGQGVQCWAQHRDYTICYAKCAAMNPREWTWANACVRGVDDAGFDKGEPKP